MWFLKCAKSAFRLLCGSALNVLISFSMEQTPPRRIGTETLHWTWWRRETQISRTCWEEMQRFWMLPKKAAWPGSRNCAAWRTSTAETHRDATRLRCTWQVMKNISAAFWAIAFNIEMRALLSFKWKYQAVTSSRELRFYKSIEAVCEISSHPRGEARKPRRKERGKCWIKSWLSSLSERCVSLASRQGFKGVFAKY